MAKIVEKGIDFQLFSVPHHCHTADNYMSKFSTCDSRSGSQTPSEDEMLPFCLQMEQVCYGSFSMGTSALLPHLKTLERLFRPLFKVAKLALNNTRFSLVCLQYVCVESVMSSAVLYMARRIKFISLKIDTTTTALLNWTK